MGVTFPSDNPRNITSPYWREHTVKPSITTGAVIALAALAFANTAIARDQINIVGSSTVYPFATVVAETFGRNSSFKTPKIEATGSGSGFKLFCEGLGINTPDISNASRRIKQKEVDMCVKNGVANIVEVKIGYDGIVLANAKGAAPISLELKHIFLALAKEVPNPDGSQSLVANPYKTWKDVDASLPDAGIEVLGPPPTSGTRDAFAEMALEGGCKKFDWIKAMKKADKKAYRKVCHTVREDGAYVESGENDNLIVQKLKANLNAFGVFGYSFLDQNAEAVQGSRIGNVSPTFEAIASGEYPVSRALYFYVKKDHVGVIPGIKEYVSEFVSDRASGNEGYLSDRGLIPMPSQEKSEFAMAIKEMRPLPREL